MVPDVRPLQLVFQMAGPHGCIPVLGHSSLGPVSALWTEHSHCVGCARRAVENGAEKRSSGWVGRFLTALGKLAVSFAAWQALLSSKLLLSSVAETI